MGHGISFMLFITVIVVWQSSTILLDSEVDLLIPASRVKGTMRTAVVISFNVLTF